MRFLILGIGATKNRVTINQIFPPYRGWEYFLVFRNNPNEKRKITKILFFVFFAGCLASITTSFPRLHLPFKDHDACAGAGFGREPLLKGRADFG